MATKGWKQPYVYDGNMVTTRLSGRSEVVFVGGSDAEAKTYCLRANCDFQVEKYGAVDSGASFSEAAKELGYPLSYSRRRDRVDQGLADYKYGGFGRSYRPQPESQPMKNPTIDISVPNRLLAAGVRVISVGEYHHGVLEMETEQGFIPIAINRNVAALLITELANFMAAEEVDPVEYAANDE